MLHPSVFLVLVLFLTSCGCQRKPSVKKKELTQHEANETLIGANQVRLKMESKKIADYIKRRKWDMTETESGLRYLIYERSEANEMPEVGVTAVINYTLSLTDGTVCYSSDSSGTRGFVVGKGEIEKGIDEGILLMNKGDKAKFVLPSHLGHGLLGDEVRIPSHAILVYDISLIDIN